jgi:hypothetical protein
MNGEETTTPRETEPARRRGRRGRAEMSRTIEDARETIEDLAGDLRDRIEESPLRALAIALGVGYVVGGGLFTRATGRMVFGTLRLGTRLMALPLVRDEVMALAEALVPEGKRRTQ